VLNAENFGVAQRRRRVFVVGCLGNWESAAKVLFESESLRGDIKKGRGEGKETSNNFIPSIAGTLDRECGGGKLNHQTATSGHIIPTFWNGSQTADALTRTSDDQRMPDKNRFQAVIQSKQIVGALCARDYKGVGNQYVEEGKCIVQPIPIHAQATQYKGGGANRNNDGKGNGLGVGKPGDPMNTLDTSSRHAVAFDAYNSSVTGNVTKTLDTGSDYHHVPNVYSPTMAVRRLTEVECERLQGFPDNYTNIKENCPSGARYKALGNSMAVPVMRWIGERINNYERL
jgi:DNA (cytosine-5)-methyltransferase 1